MVLLVLTKANDNYIIEKYTALPWLIHSYIDLICFVLNSFMDDLDSYGPILTWANSKAFLSVSYPLINMILSYSLRKEINYSFSFEVVLAITLID